MSMLNGNNRTTIVRNFRLVPWVGRQEFVDHLNDDAAMHSDITERGEAILGEVREIAKSVKPIKDEFDKEQEDKKFHNRLKTNAKKFGAWIGKMLFVVAALAAVASVPQLNNAFGRILSTFGAPTSPRSPAVPGANTIPSQQPIAKPTH
jgi:hypothetical protein